MHPFLSRDLANALAQERQRQAELSRLVAEATANGRRGRVRGNGVGGIWRARRRHRRRMSFDA